MEVLFIMWGMERKANNTTMMMIEFIASYFILCQKCVCTHIHTHIHMNVFDKLDEILDRYEWIEEIEAN